jgi:two-component system response regulator PilR (NtrC family)
MANLWIVDRSPRRRGALARLAAAAETAVLGAPGDPRFESAAEPDVVLMALDGDWERELQFAHACGDRATGARWILVGARGDERAALELFDTRPFEFLAYPPPALALRAKIAAGRVAGAAPALSERSHRAAVSTRFARWFEDLELPDVLRALDPRLADVPVLIRGEPGTGRAVVARYVHLFGGASRGPLAHVACTAATRAADVANAAAELRGSRRGAASITLWLEDVERLPLATQRALLGWIELGAPPGAAAPLVRWIATAHEGALDGLDPDLRLALSGLPVRLPPLRERPHAIARIAAATARAWCTARRERTRRFGEDALAVMEEYPWPGNLRELEALVVQSLAAVSSDPLHADDLQLDGAAFAPIEAAAIGKLVEEHEGPAQPAVPTEAEIEELLHEVEPEEEPPRPRAPVSGARDAAGANGVLARLVGALSREVRDPLATLRTLAELLPERFDDPEFRERFAQMARDDVDRVESLVGRLAAVANLAHPERDKVDVAALLEDLLEQRRQSIRAQRLLVLKELDTSEPHALCDRAQLQFALDTLLGKALEWVPTHGDVYLASRHHPAGPSGGPSVRILIRFHHPPSPAGGRAQASVEGSLELMIAEIVLRAQGGSLSVTSTDGEETVIVIDLPAP